MDISISNFIQATPILNKDLRKTEAQKTIQKNATNSITALPNFAQSAHLISFGKDAYFTANDFMLPSKCNPDPYQVKAGRAIKNGENVVVTAPTGTGKTAIANFAIKNNFKDGKKTFYTTPLKALSNQKYRDLQKMFGEENVGILTGDKKENAQAPIVVMTTEIYRNMVASNFFDEHNSQLDNLKSVVFDEFHYMNDNERGSVWEESIMFTPKDTQIIALSATVGNNKKIAKWIKDKSTQPTKLIDVPAEARIVKLEFTTIPPSKDNEISGKTEKHAKARNRKGGKFRSRGSKFSDKTSQAQSSRLSVNAVLKEIFDLRKEDKLPAITFVFSKKYAAGLVKDSGEKGIDLTSKQEKNEIKAILRKYKHEKQLYTNNLDEKALMKGYAIHSAAILPAQKELIEELFNKKLIKVVYATETLAAGINMPARSVIITDCEKPTTTPYGKKSRRNLTANEFHQMSGRAGRRGMDKKGYVILMPANKEKAAVFEELKKAAPNVIESKLKLDASSVTGFFKKTSQREKMKEILDMSFCLYDQNENKREDALQEHMETFDAYTELLKKYGCLIQVQGGAKTTDKGELVGSIKGKPQLPILQSILNKTFKDVRPENFAGIVSAIALTPDSKDGIAEKPQINEELDRVNEQIDTMLMPFKKHKDGEIDHSAQSPDILKFAKSRASVLKDSNSGETLFYLSESELREKSNILQSRKDEIEYEEQFMGASKETFDQLSEITAHQNLIEEARNLQYLYGKLERTLKYRDDISPKSTDFHTDELLNLYNQVQQEYDKYNKQVKHLSTTANIPFAQLNTTIMPLIQKWAALNANSDDRQTNWDIISNEIKENQAVKYDGSFFNAVAQTIDFINQIEELAYKAIPMSRGADLQYLSQLRDTCKQSIKLLKQPPLYLEGEETENI